MLAKNENLAEFDLSTFVFDIGKMVALRYMTLFKASKLKARLLVITLVSDL